MLFSENSVLHYRKNSGLALPTVLILLFVITLLGITTLKVTVLEEKMSSNFRMRQVALNAAESTLKFAEQHAQTLKSTIRGGPLPLRGGGFTQLYTQNPSLTDTPDNPPPSGGHEGDLCVGGYCIPAEYSLVASSNFVEKWEDASLDVWNDDTKHHLYTDFSSTKLDLEGVSETPKYIIEYMGNYPLSLADGQACGPPASTTWPYCLGDNSHFRVTARALAGFPGQELAIILQSTIRVP